MGKLISVILRGSVHMTKHACTLIDSAVLLGHVGCVDLLWLLLSTFSSLAQLHPSALLCTANPDKHELQAGGITEKLYIEVLYSSPLLQVP